MCKILCIGFEDVKEARLAAKTYHCEMPGRALGKVHPQLGEDQPGREFRTMW